MLNHLSIRNIVLIEKLDLDFQSGLTVLTGETGAGKSILLDSVGLILGDRAETRLIRKGCEAASVTASFTLPHTHAAFDILREADFDTTPEDGLIIRRQLNSNGQNKAFLNDAPISLTLLKAVGAVIADIHAQFDTHHLMNEQNHMSLVDLYGDYSALCDETRTLWTELSSIRREITTKKEMAEKAKQEEDYLRFVLDEMKTINPKEGEHEELDKKRIEIKNKSALLNAFSMADQALNGETGADNQLMQAIKALQTVEDKAGEDLTALLDDFSSVQQNLSDALFRFQHMINDIDGQDGSLDSIEERLLTIRDLARKHKCLPEELPAKMQEIADKINLIENLDHDLSTLLKRERETATAFEQTARALHQKRIETALIIDQKVMQELPAMKMERAVFTIAMDELPPEKWNKNGLSMAQFKIATNPGSAVDSLSKIASGGEISRLMLAIKVVLSHVEPHETLIFDEVDTGIGGATADAVGVRLQTLSNDKQVLVVTHSPQVAAKGIHHYHVLKTSDDHTTQTDVITLDDTQRVDEIARMISGAAITPEAKTAAKQLIAQSHLSQAKKAS